MELLSNILIGIIAILHFYILVMEIFLWTKPRTMKVFGMKLDQALICKTLAANMGLYNGFLASGLLYGLIANNLEFKIFFLICILIAGIFGGFTASKKIIYIQSVPALLTLILMYLI